MTAQTKHAFLHCNILDSIEALRTVDMVMARGTLIEHPRIERIPEIDKVLDTVM